MALIYSQNWAAGNSLFTSMANYQKPTHGTDPLYPAVRAASICTIASGALTCSTANFYNCGVWLKGMGALTGGGSGFYGGSGFWDGHQGWVEVKYTPVAGGLLYWSPIVQLPRPDGAYGGLSLSWDPSISRYSLNYNVESGSAPVTFVGTAPAAGVAITYRLAWKCGTVDPTESFRLADGYVKVYINDALIYTGSSLRLYHSWFTYPYDRMDSVMVGFNGLLGPSDDLVLHDTEYAPPVVITPLTVSVYDLRINGVSYNVLFESLDVKWNANGRDTLACQLLNTPNFRPPRGASVHLYEDAVLIFEGIVDVPREEGFGGIGWALIAPRVSAVSIDAYADRRFVFTTFPTQPLKNCLVQLAPYLAPYGITLSGSQADGPAIAGFKVDGDTLTETLNTLSEASGGWVWDILPGKTFKMFPPGTTFAPFNISADGDGKALGDITVEEPDSDYANRIILRFTAAARRAYAFMTPATNFAVDDEVELGSQTYKFVSVLTETNNEVMLGGSIDASLNNLITTINGDPGGEGVVYSNGTHKNATAEAYLRFSGWLTAQAITPGDRGNDIDVSTTKADAHWFNEGNIEWPTMKNGEDESLTNKVFANDLDEQANPPAGRGLWERIIDKPTVFDYGLAQMWADAYLAKGIATPKQVTYVTEQKGIYPGMTQTINSAIRNLSGSFIVTEVSGKLVTDSLMWRTVTASGGVTLPKMWMETAKNIFQGGGGGGNSAGGSLVVTSGGGGSSIGITSFPLGGNREDARVTGAGVKMAIKGAFRYHARTSFNGLVITEMRAMHAGVTVKAWLLDEAAPPTFFPCGQVTGTTPEEIFTNVEIIAGHNYVLYMEVDTANEGGYLIGTLEAL